MLPEVHARARVNFSQVASVEAPDPHTVVFRLKTPYPGFIYAFETSSAPMMPKHIYAGTDYRNNPANARPIGTGPFRFKEWQRGSIIRMERNPDYFKPGCLSRRHQLRRHSRRRQRLIALESARSISPRRAISNSTTSPGCAAFADPGRDRGYEFLAPLSWLEMNNKRKPMDDKRFRRPSCMPSIASSSATRSLRPRSHADRPINSVVTFYDGNVKRYALDRKKSEALLDEMG